MDQEMASPTLLSSVQGLASQQSALSSSSVHPFFAKPESTISLLHQVVDITTQLSHSLSSHLSLPLANPKLLSLYRQHANLSQTLHLSDQNIGHTLETLRSRTGINYGEDVPLDRSMIVDWCVGRLEAWGTSAQMETFREEEREGRMTVVLGGKVLVIDVELSVNRSDPDCPMVTVAGLKTSYAIPNTASGSTTQGSLSLDGFLADRLQAFLTEVQKEPEEQDCLRAERFGRLFSEDLIYLMQLDQLALNEGDGGLRWFSDIDALAQETEKFAMMEAEAIVGMHPDTHIPLDVFLARSHTLPLPYLTGASISFLTHVSPQAYLALLRTCPRPSPASLSQRVTVSNLDIPFPHLRAHLASYPRPQGVTAATLVFSSTTTPSSDPAAMDMSDLRSRPTFPLVLTGTQVDHTLPQVTSMMGDSRTWVLDFTDGGQHSGITMSQSRMREIELVVNPLSGMSHIDSMPMMAFGSGSWLDLLLNPANPISPERYTTLYTSPTGAHPQLHLRLTAPDEPGFILEKVPVHTLKEIWGILEIVKEQCWLNEIISAYTWTPEGLNIGEGLGEDIDDSEATQDDLQAILKGTLTPRRIPVNVYLPAPPPPEPLFDPTDMSGMSLTQPMSSHMHRTRIVMASPERPPIPGMVEISVAFDPSRPRGVTLDVSGAMGADLNSDVLEEVCRRGGALSLPGRVWAKSHGVS